MGILGIAQQGLEQAQDRLAQTAQRIARAGAPPSAGDSVELLSGRNQYEADLGVARVGDEEQKATLDLLA